MRLLTRKTAWTAPQRQMLRSAARHHSLRGLVLTVVLVLATVAGLVARGRLKEADQAAHAARLVDQLFEMETPQVPGVIQEMAAYRRWTDPLLRKPYAGAGADHDARHQLHASLALLPVDPDQVEYLYQRLLDAQPQEVAVLREALSDHKGPLLKRLWAIVERPAHGQGRRRLRAACALASYDPTAAGWDKASGRVVEQLVSASPMFLERWVDVLRPVRAKLLAPLCTIYLDRTPERAGERTLATSIVADYATDWPEILTELLLDADARQFAVLFPRVEARREKALPIFQETVETSLDTERAEQKKERLARRQANAAVALLKMGQAERVWPLLSHGPDARARTYLLHCVGALGVDPAIILERLEGEPDVSIRRALLLLLGDFGTGRLSLADRVRLLPKVLDRYRSDPDPGVHAAAAWLLRHWKRDQALHAIDQEWAEDQHKEQRLDQIAHELASGQDRALPQWYVNGQGQTMVVIPGPVQFVMGSAPTEQGREGGPEGKVETQHRMQIGRSFAITSREVTVAQFLRFRGDHAYDREHAPKRDCPMNCVRWYDAAAYCNWLSEQEGIPQDQWCYLPAADGSYAEGMKLAANYLGRTGYRLPSQAEWEYACRAGAGTRRFYGEAEELVDKYAWCGKSAADRCLLPVGTLKPNDLGLFDMLGNAAEWCQERFTYLDVPTEDAEDPQALEDDQPRAVRGGSAGDLPEQVRCARRSRFPPTTRLKDLGFRVARTVRVAEDPVSEASGR